MKVAVAAAAAAGELMGERSALPFGECEWSAAKNRRSYETIADLRMDENGSEVSEQCMNR